MELPCTLTVKLVVASIAILFYVHVHIGRGGGGGGVGCGVALGSFSSSFIASMLYICTFFIDILYMFKV